MTFPDSDRWSDYIEITDSTLRDAVESAFKKNITDVYFISAVARLGEKWIVKFERRVIPKET